MLFPDEERAVKIGFSLRDPRLVEVFIKSDPQFHSVAEIIERLGFIDGSLYIMGVALISYMLSARGEAHWRLAAQNARPPFSQSLLDFVRSSPSLAKLRAQRLGRIEKYLRESVPKLKRLLDAKVVDLDLVHRALTESLGAGSDRKTVVFAVKMLYYSLMVVGRESTACETIPIPVDYRVALVTFTSGLLRGWTCDQDLKALAQSSRTRYRQEIIRLWSIVAREAKVPPLALDSIVWVSGLCIDKNLRHPDKIQECLSNENNIGAEYSEKIRILWSELEACFS